MSSSSSPPASPEVTINGRTVLRGNLIRTSTSPKLTTNDYLGLDHETGELLMIRDIQILNSESAAPIEDVDVMMRLSQSRNLSHPNLLKYYGWLQCNSGADGRYTALMEYVAGGTLAEMVESYGALSLGLVKQFARQIVEGLVHLNGEDIVCRGLSNEDVMVGNEGTVKLGCWLAERGTDGGKSNVWSLGFLVLELLTGKKCPEQSKAPVLEDNVVAGLDEEALMFLWDCWTENAAERPTIEQLLRARFLQSV